MGFGGSHWGGGIPLWGGVGGTPELMIWDPGDKNLGVLLRLCLLTSCAQFFMTKMYNKMQGSRSWAATALGGGHGGLAPSRATEMGATWVVPFSPGVSVFPSGRWDQAAAMGHGDPGFSHLLVCDFGPGYQGEDLGGFSPLPQRGRRVLCPCRPRPWAAPAVCSSGEGGSLALRLEVQMGCKAGALRMAEPGPVALSG